MNVIDIHAHIYERVAGITRGQPMASTDLGRVAIGNEEVQFLPPSFEQSRSTAEMLIAYMDWCGIEKAVLMPNPYYGYHNRYFADSVKRYPDRLRGVALVDIMKGQEAARELASIYDQGILFGFKVEVDSTFQCAPGTRLSDSGCLLCGTAAINTISRYSSTCSAQRTLRTRASWPQRIPISASFCAIWGRMHVLKKGCLNPITGKCWIW